MLSLKGDLEDRRNAKELRPTCECWSYFKKTRFLWFPVVLMLFIHNTVLATTG